MRILSFDPGHMTGIACIDGAGGVDFFMTADSDRFKRPKFLQSLQEAAEAQVILIEKPPTFVKDMPSVEVFYLIDAYYRAGSFKVEHIFPGQWKGIVDRVSLPSTHAADAATMAMWYRRSHG